jgi:diadenosine tetraphosphatase ApaH/serine/threonine PP2A family protein phosphatase
VRIALISDIHANLEALQTVLADIDRRIDTAKGDQIWNLGDIIGYGPNPVECADLVARRCRWSLLGNHDYGVLYEPTNFNAVAERAAYWTREQFEAESARDQAGAVKRWEFLGKLRVRVSEGPFLCVHGTPRRPINEYLFPEDAESSPGKMADIFKRIKSSGAHYCLVGHTHVPGVFTEDGDFYFAKEMNNQTWEFKLTSAANKPVAAGEPESAEAAEGPRPERLIINPGSVGQPRDLDPRASYAIIDAEEVKDERGQAQIRPRTVQFFRLEYDIATTRSKISAVAEEIAARNAATRDETGCVQKLANVAPEPALAWLDRHIADLEAVAGREKKGSPMAAAVQERVDACRGLRTEVAARADMTTKDLTRRILESDQQFRAELERYSWLGNRLAEGR